MGGGGVAFRLVEEEVLPGVVGDQLDSLNLEYWDLFLMNANLNKEALAKSSSVNMDLVSSGLSKVKR